MEAVKQKRFGNNNHEEKVVVASRMEIKKWVDRAIDIDYSREGVLDLLNNGKRSLKEIGRILNIFDKEVYKIKKKKIKEGEGKVGLSFEKGGVASRIVTKGKKFSY